MQNIDVKMDGVYQNLLRVMACKLEHDDLYDGRNAHFVSFCLVMIAMIILMRSLLYVKQSNVLPDNSSVEINNAFPMRLSVMV